LIRTPITLASIIFLIVGIVGNFRSYNLPDISPSTLVSIFSSQSSLFKKSLDHVIEDQITSVNGLSFEKKWEFDFLIDQCQIGDSVNLAMKNGDNISVPLVKRYGESNKFLVPLLLLLGTTFWAIGFYVLKTKPREWAARIFYSTCMTATIAVMIIWPGCPQSGDIIGLFYVILYWLLFPLIPAFILYFTLLYPNKKRILSRKQRLPLLIFSPGFFLALLIGSTYILATVTTELRYYRIFYLIYNIGFRSLLIFYLVLSLTTLIFSYNKSQSSESKKKVLWIIWGIAIGLFPFLFLWTLPQLAGYPPLISEIAMYIFMMIIPISIAVSIIKYQALNINFIVEKSVLYLLSAFILFLLFLLVVALTNLDFRQIIFEYRLQLNISIFVLAVALTPLLSQKILFYIKRYFGGEYNFPLILKNFSSALSTLTNPQKIFPFFIEKVAELVPSKKIAIISSGPPNDVIRILDSFGFSSNEIIVLRESKNLDMALAITNSKTADVAFGQPTIQNRTTLAQIYRQSFFRLYYSPYKLCKRVWGFLFIQPEQQNDFRVKNDCLEKLGVEISQPILLQNKHIGTLLLGRKKSGTEWTKDEIDLVSQIASEVFYLSERFRLQQAMILQQTEKQKLEELNQLKSDFVSLVSHELRSPLTSITWSVDNLLDGIPEKPGPKIVEYLSGIRDSSSHLTRMIENLLDLTKIEAGSIEFYPQKLILQDSIVQAIDTVGPLAEAKNIEINFNVDRKYWIQADKDFVIEILVNLLDNAIKYSESSTAISIRAKQIDKGNVTTFIIDHGIGIPKESLSIIFDRFSRIKQTTKRANGLGLGLHIVNQLVKLQGGSIAVSSKKNIGSTFSVALPGGSTEKI
jgi:signal transduction histidine kinase